MGTFGHQQPWTDFKCFSAYLPLLALGTLEYHLIGTIVAVCVESLADSVVGGESAGGTFKGLLASLTVQYPTSVHPADIGQAVVTGVLGICSGAWMLQEMVPGPLLPQGRQVQADDLKQGRLQESHLPYRAGLL